jgi:hypothetical protein
MGINYIERKEEYQLLSKLIQKVIFDVVMTIIMSVAFQILISNDSLTQDDHQTLLDELLPPIDAKAFPPTE